jgi:hypothetical protein
MEINGNEWIIHYRAGERVWVVEGSVEPKRRRRRRRRRELKRVESSEGKE